MPAPAVKTQYASGLPYFTTTAPGWVVSPLDAQRLQSYDLYDDLYDNSPDKVAAMLRGNDGKPILVPTAKRLVKTLGRYVGKGWGYVVSGGPSEQQTLCKETMGAFFKRESILSQFTTGKAEYLRRGDWLWYVSADPEKPAGSRLSLRTIDPRTYFPITEDDEDLDRLTGARIVEEYLLSDGVTLALKVQTWYKSNHPEHEHYGEPQPESDDPRKAGWDIEYSVQIFDTMNWDNEKRKLLSTPVEQTTLTGIKKLPIYHIKHDPDTGSPWGKSIYAGLESLMAGINQAITDEDMALALAGLGMYWTDSGAPVDPDTQEPQEDWELGPEMVVEVGVGRKFERLKGIDSVAPIQEHVKYLEESTYGMTGVNDIALGKSSAQPKSGIALLLEMGPLMDAADDIDLQINDGMDHLLYDLQQYWFPEYEGLDFTQVSLTSETDKDRLPFDREGRWKELTDGYAANIFPLEYVHRKLKEEFGYDLTTKELKAALDQAAIKAAQADPFGARTEDELGDPSKGEPGAA